MLILPAPVSAYDVKPKVSIRGVTYQFTYRWNERSLRWKLDIESLDSTEKVYGLTLVENVDLTSHIQTPPFSWQGFIIALPTKNTKQPLGRDNFGSDKGYELLFIGYAEL